MYRKTIVPVIEAHYENLSAVERSIADFFIHNQEEMDFSSKHISSILYVSEASLSRFAKKCGFKGYREFIYNYQESFNKGEAQISGRMREVFDAYQELLNNSYNLVDETQLRRLAKIMSEKNRVFVYGKGSSGLAAREMQFRFRRLGLDMDAIDDSDVMHINSAIINPSSLVMGISISGKTEEVLTSLRQAHQNGAVTVLFTANSRPEFQNFCDEIVYIAAKKNLDFGNIISPQYPVLVITDILYGYYLETDPQAKELIHENTVWAIQKNKWGEEESSRKETQQ